MPPEFRDPYQSGLQATGGGASNISGAAGNSGRDEKKGKERRKGGNAFIFEYLGYFCETAFLYSNIQAINSKLTYTAYFNALHSQTLLSYSLIYYDLSSTNN